MVGPDVIYNFKKKNSKSILDSYHQPDITVTAVTQLYQVTVEEL